LFGTNFGITDAYSSGYRVRCSLKFWFSGEVAEVVQKLSHVVVLEPFSSLTV
jgi:hypothetical protein